jgi:hypothetical protein
MKRYSVLSVLWLAACGAGAGQGDDNSTLSAPLATGDEDAAEQTDLASSDESYQPASIPDTGSSCDGTEQAASAGADPIAAPGLVIGGGGQAWAPPAAGAVVWCHADVPIGCPAIEPAPNGGRLVVVAGPIGGGAVAVDVAGGEPSSGAEGEITFGEAGGSAVPDVETTFGEAGSAAGPEGEIIFVDAVPMPGAPPSAPVPVVIGGSLPPFPGTCVAVSFGVGGELNVAVGAGGIGTAPDQPPSSGIGTAPDQPPSSGGSAADPGQLPSSGSSTVPDEPPSSGSGTGGPGQPSSGGVSTDVAGVQHPSAGGSTAPTPPPHGGALPGVPALPPPGLCLGVSFPVPPGAPIPGTAPVNGHGPGSAPSPEAGACVAVAFATSADPNAPVSAPALPVMCAASHAAPQPAGSAASEAPVPADEPVRADELH